MKAKKIIFTASCLVALALFAAHEALLNFWPESSAVRNAIKFLISSIPFALCASTLKKEKSALNFFITLGLFACCLGDLCINIVFILSICIYLVGHSFFIKSFFSCKKPGAFHFALWGILLSAICAALLFLDISAIQKIEGIVYSTFMCAMVAFSFCAPPLIRAGGIIFGISDILLMVNIVIKVEDGPLHIIALGIYYVGVFLMAASLYLQKAPSPKEMQERPAD